MVLAYALLDTEEKIAPRFARLVLSGSTALRNVCAKTVPHVHQIMEDALAPRVSDSSLNHRIVSLSRPNFISFFYLFTSC